MLHWFFCSRKMKRLLLDRKKMLSLVLTIFVMTLNAKLKTLHFLRSCVMYFMRVNKGIPSQSLVYFKRLVCLEVPDRKQ